MASRRFLPAGTAFGTPEAADLVHHFGILCCLHDDFAIPLRLAIRMTVTWDQPAGIQHAWLPGGEIAAISRYMAPSACNSRMRSTTDASNRSTRRAIVTWNFTRFSGPQVHRFAM